MNHPGTRRPSRGAPRRQARTPAGTTTTKATPKVAPPSPLEAALDASASTPAPAVSGFAELGVPDAVVALLTRQGITTPSPIQAKAIPDGIARRDVLGRAQTGSGKTLAFGLPVLARLASERTPASPRRPRALVLVPTRELAEQVKDALLPLAQALSLRVATVYGGASMSRQVDALQRGVHLVVATPGRLEDHLRQGTCSLDRIAFTVLDEADYMADLGFLPAVTRLLDDIPAGTQRLLFSATLDRGVQRLVDRYLRDPALHAVAAVATPVENMEHRSFTVEATQKVAVAAEIARRPGRTLFFVRTKHGADRLATQISKAGVEAGALHGNLRQSQRQRALDAFASGRARVLVATDVAARGIHVDDVDLVVHYDPPADEKDYLHRSGRTARAGASGTVLSLLLPHEVSANDRMHRQLGTSVSSVRVHPEHQAVNDLATSGDAIEVTPLPSREREAVPARRPQAPRGSRPRSASRVSASRGRFSGR